MKSDEIGASDNTKRDNNCKRLYTQLTRGSNIYSSLPNHGSAVKKKKETSSGTQEAGGELNVSNYCTGNRRQGAGNKKKSTTTKAKSTTSSATTTTTTTTTPKIIPITSRTHETEEAGHQDLPPYMNLNEESFEDDDEHSFGLSKDLSTESIKKACDHFDDDFDEHEGGGHFDGEDVSDDDLIEIHHTPHCFQKANSLRRSLKSHAALSIDRQRKGRQSQDEHPLCTLPRSNPSSHRLDEEEEEAAAAAKQRALQASSQDEVNDVLNELDAILDDHAASSILDASMLSTSNSNEDEARIEDCLMDLDNYLAGIDDSSLANYEYEDAKSASPTKATSMMQRRNRTLPRNLRAFSGPNSSSPSSAHPSCDHDASASENFRRGHALRKTISSDISTDRCYLDDTSLPLPIALDTAVNSTPTRLRSSHEWRRNSMRKTSPLILPSGSSDDGDDDAAASPMSDPLQGPHLDRFAVNDPNEATGNAAVQGSSGDLMELETLSQSGTTTANGALRRCFSQSNVPNTSMSMSQRPTAEMLTTADILQNILVQNESGAASEEPRPRQFGRRTQGQSGRVLTMQAEALQPDNRRPRSAPAAAAERRSASAALIGSEPSSIGSSRNPSPVSLGDSSSTDSSSTTTLNPTHDEPSPLASGEEGVLPACGTPLDPNNIQLISRPGNNAIWPHSFSRILALSCCSLGLFNICRFAILTIQYGGNFLLQFLLLSFIFGIPLLWLQMCLGSKIKAGPVTMWKISPICKGIGIALVIAQCVLTVYSSIGVAWVVIYLRDSFLSKAQALYRWQEPYFTYRYILSNNTGNLTETVADYFNGFVLQRLQMADRRSDTGGPRFHVNDRLAFNLALIWTFVFLVLCKGLKSYGKAVLGLAILPVVGLIVITGKLLTVIDFTALQNIFSASDFEDFLINSKTWSAAAQEAFLTWGLCGPSVIAMSSRLHTAAQSKEVLRRDAILVVVSTLFGLSLAALLGLACVQILHEHQYIYVPGSYENMETYMAVFSLKAPINTSLVSFPPKWVPHYSTLLGETYRRPTAVPNRESGYQALRLISELFPAAMALCSDQMSWMWTVAAFVMFLGFGLAQMCAMWKPISSALGNSTSSVLLSCVTGLLLSIPFATEMGITIVHYMDLLMGGSWILPLLWMAQILGVFLVRGRPYNGDDLVNDLRMSISMSAFLALAWNVLLPIGLIALSIVQYKISNSNQFFNWRGKFYFTLWSRKLGGFVQIGFLLLVPIAAIVQIYRYLTSGPPDILDRIQLLYRPPEALLDGRSRPAGDVAAHLHNRLNRSAPNQTDQTRPNNLNAHHTQDDAPPKYTPPPSYTTATGARLAKILRQSIRRSVRRLMNNTSRTRPELSLVDGNEQSLPPDYAALHMNDNVEIGGQRSVDTNFSENALSLGRNIHLQKLNLLESTTGQQRPYSASAVTERNPQRGQSGRPFTAQDVATILRSSTRRARGVEDDTSAAAAAAAIATCSTTRFSQMNDMEDEANCSSYSAENLILNAEPLGESAAIAASVGQLEDLNRISDNRERVNGDASVI